jgi:HEPN domain-containing protein
VNKKGKRVIDRKIIEENEGIARKAYEQGEYVLCFLLAHALVESLLRAFLTRTGKENFNDLINAYSDFMKSEGQTNATFVKELTEFNRRRNRVIHNLWTRGYFATNEKLEPSCRAAFIVYGLFVEWLETFDPEITEVGFQYEV